MVARRGGAMAAVVVADGFVGFVVVRRSAREPVAAGISCGRLFMAMALSFDVVDCFMI